jgi:hypothetical protein
VTATVDELAAQVRHHAVEAAVRRVAPELGADADRLMDSAAFFAATSTLDPDGPDFASQVVAAVKQAAERDSRFRTGSATSARADPPAAPAGRGERQWTDEDVERSTPKELQAAIDKGLLADMMVGSKPRRHRRRGQ